MSELRDNLEAAQRAHHALQYPGDLTADVSAKLAAGRGAPRRHRLWPWLLAGAGLVGTGIAATLALIVVIAIAGARHRSQQIARQHGSGISNLPALSLSGVPSLALPPSRSPGSRPATGNHDETIFSVGAPSLTGLPALAPDIPTGPLVDLPKEPSS